ncbi:tetratricopeptide repeat protein [Melioribacteraceae bacterium 4301-Me]|uniref:tetratricopeptide repeat protein n=1 Tax=Pyranulibacter aquaticus TaxID=3163344 RepID=UPI00359B3DA1
MKKVTKQLGDGKYKAVIKETTAARTVYPNNFFFYTIEAIACSMLGQSQKALDLLKVAEKKFPDSYEVHFQLAKVYDEMEEFDKAEESYKKSYELTPKEYSDARSDCLNDLGSLYWKIGYKQEAIDNWKLALQEYPQNKNAKNNLKRCINVYGEPKAVSEAMDDISHFYDIQMRKYFAVKNISEFSSLEEANKFMLLIKNAWNNTIVQEKEKLETYTPEEKTKWFESIEIDFDAIELKSENKEKKAGIASKPKKKKRGKLSAAQKEQIEFERKFYFLPEDGLTFAILASPFLLHAGLKFDRLDEILREGTEDEEEQELLIWAADIGHFLFESFGAEDDDIAKDFLSEALEIATEIIDEEDALESLEIIIDTFRKFGEDI